MSLRQRWFKPDWQHSDSERRLRAVRESRDPELLAALPRLAREDPDANIRLVALRRIEEPSALEHCRRRDADKRVREQAEKQIVELLVRGNGPDQAKLARQVLDAEPKLPVASIERMATESKGTAVREAALQHIDRPGFLGDRVLAEPDRGLREQTLQRITQRSTLERISKRLRRQDKTLFQAAQRRLNELDPNRREASGSDDARALCEGVEALARGESVQDLAAQLGEIESRWQYIDSPDPALQRRFDGACRILHNALSRDTHAEPEVTDPVADESESGGGPVGEQAEPDSDRETPEPALAALESRLDELLATEPPDKKGLRNWLQRWQQAWSALEQPGPADEALRHRLEPRAKQFLAAATAEDTAERRAQTERAGQRARLMDELGSALEAGKLVQANRLAQQLHGLIDNDLTSAERREWQHNVDRLNELRAWQRWSDNQVRARLIEDLDALLADEPTADAISARVREARASWDDLQRQEAEHGMRPLKSDHPLVRQFNGACGRAMRQARPFLEKRRQVQKERLRAVESLLQDIDDALEREVESRELLRLRRTAANAMRQVGDLPAPARKSSAQALRQRLDRIGRVVEERAEQVEKNKRRLIREAEQLAHVEDHVEAIRQAKELQRQWQQAGNTRRGRERELWAEFRRPIDPLFEQEDERRRQAREARRTELAEQQRLCTELEEIAGLDADELTDRAGRVETLREEWSRHQKPDAKLKQRFERALRRFSQRQDEHAQAMEQARRKHEQEAARRYQACAEALLGGKQAPEPPEAAAQLPEDPADLRRLLEDNSAAARKLCIEAEFLAGIASPAEDREARMAYQVERLAGHLGGAHSSDARTELDQLQQRWLQTYPLLPAQERELRKRFETALDMASKNV